MANFSATITADPKPLLKAIREKSIKAARLLAEEGRNIINDDIMGTWNTKYPINIKPPSVIGGIVRAIIVWESNPGPRGKVPFWLNFGTSVGFFVVSDDWVSKTSSSRLRSVPGRGTIKIVPTPVNEGIEARRFDDKVSKLLAIRAPTLLKPIYG